MNTEKSEAPEEPEGPAKPDEPNDVRNPLWIVAAGMASLFAVLLAILAFGGPN